MTALTTRMLAEIVRYELGAAPGGPLEFRAIVSQAGNHLVGMRQWRWLEGREVRLRPRAAIELTGGTWDEANLRLTKLGAFASYSWLLADTVRVTEGTGATTGTYEVAARIDDDTIELASSIGAAADGQTDIEAALPNDQVQLPSDFDFQEIQAYALTNDLSGYFQFTSPQTILDLKQWSATGGGIGFWGLVRWVRSSAGGQAIPRLELWPGSSDNREELVIYYRAGWRDPADDDEVLGLPQGGWLNMLFIEIVKAILLGHEESEGGTVNQRLTALRGGVLVADAARRDGMIQPDWGPLQNGWMDCPRIPLSRYDFPTEGLSVP